MKENFPFDVFLSHSSKDKAIVRTIANRLRSDGLKVWFDEWLLKPGDSIPAKIEEGLEQSRMLVLCMSANAFGSDWAELEAYTFRFRDPLNRERRFIPFRVDDSPIKGALAQLLYVDYRTRSEEAIGILLSACRGDFGEAKPIGDSMSSMRFGLVGAVLNRKSISWPLKDTKSVADLFRNVRANGELFIVARSLESWYLPDNHLPLLGKLIVERNLHCTIAIPHPHKRIRSLVADDPSQNFRLRIWDEIQEKLVAEIGNEQTSGRLEIYGIPAYVPSTFLAIMSEDNFDYCSLEVGIGVPPGESAPPRVHIVFRKQTQSELTLDEHQTLYGRMESIYRGILKERVPLIRLPGGPDVFPEADQELEARYEYAKELLLRSETSVASTNLRTNTDVYDGNAELFPGQAVCLASLPIDQYHGCCDAIDLAHKAREWIEESVRHEHSKNSKFRWLEASSMFVPIFWYKRSFYEAFLLSDDEERLFFEMRQWLEARSAFSVKFRRLLIDPNGIIYLAGFERPAPADRSQEPLLTAIRNGLDAFSDHPNARHTPKRPLDILLQIGHVKQSLKPNETDALKRCLAAHFVLPQVATPLHIDRLRMVTFQLNKKDGGLLPSHVKEIQGCDRIYLKQNPGWLRYFAEGKPCENVNVVSSYGVLSPRKWLAHPTIVEKVKAGQFKQIMPITIQIAPSLRCTNRCPICSYGKIKKPLLKTDVYMKPGTGKSMRSPRVSTPIHMSRHDMINVIHRFGEAGVKGVIFSGGGEPLMNSSTLEGMLYARRGLLWEQPESRDARNRQKLLSVGLFTNGHLLHRDDGIVKIARDIDPTFVRVSLNAGNSKAYSLIHGTRPEDTDITFENALTNIEQLARARQQYSSSFKLDIGVLITPLILDNLLDLAYALKRIAFRYPGMLNCVAIRPAVRYDGGCWNQEAVEDCERYLESSEYVRFARSFREFMLQGKQFPRAVFEEAERIINEQVRPILGASLREIERITVSLPKQRFDDLTKPISGRKCDPCLAAPLVTFVGPDTTVYHCVERALNPAVRYGKLSKLEDNSKEGLLSFLISGRQRCADSLLTGCPPVCLLHEYNEVFSEIDVRLEGNDRERTQHEIDVAAGYFKERVASALGEEVANFI